MKECVFTRCHVTAVFILCWYIFSANSVFAQTGQVSAIGLEQGRWLVGGSLGGANFAINELQSFNLGGSISTRTFSSVGIGVGTNLGYLLSKNFVLGGQVGVSFNAAGGENFAAGISALGLSLGPFMRYYFLHLSPSVGLFGGLGVNYAATFNLGSSITIHNANAALTLGSTCFVSRDVALEVLVSYDRRFMFVGEQRINAVSGSPILLAYPAMTSNNGLLRVNVGFQIFLDKIF